MVAALDARRVADLAANATTLHFSVGGRRLMFVMSGSDSRQKQHNELYGKQNYPPAWRTQYQLHALPPRADMVDIGANIGTAATIAYVLHAHECIRIVALEPLPETYLFLLWNLHANGVPILAPTRRAWASALSNHEPMAKGCGGVMPLNQAITADGRNVVITLEEGSSSMTASMKSPMTAIGGASAAPPDADAPPSTRATALARTLWRGATLAASTDGGAATAAKARPTTKGSPAAAWRPSRSFTVPSVTLPSLLDGFRITRLSLLKLDCEGCENELLPQFRAYPSLAGRVPRAAGEIHGCGRLTTAGNNHYRARMRARGPQPSVHCVANLQIVAETWGPNASSAFELV